MKFNPRDQRGFSLIQILIAIGLMGAVSLGLAQLMTSLARMQGQANVQADLLDIMNDVQMSLVRSQACLISLKSSPEINSQSAGAAPSLPLNIQKIVDENGREILRVGARVAQTPLNVTSITATLDPSVSWNASALHKLNVEVLMQYNDQSYLATNSMLRRRFALTIETGADKTLIACSRIDMNEQRKLEQAICASHGGSISPTSGLCDLSKSTSLLQAACETMGLTLDTASGVHCK